MDINKILNADYLDLLFDGRNKKYGSYELRKKYNKRVIIGAIIAFFLFGAAFLSTLIEMPDSDVIVEAPIIKDVKLADPPPIDEKAPPPPPPKNLPPPPVKPTVKFTPPVIKQDDEVLEEDKPEPPKPEENKVVGPKDIEGTDDPNAIDPGLNTNPGTGDGPVSSGPKEEQIFRFVDQEALPPGGVAAFSRYLARNTAYPVAAKQAGIQGRVTYEFVVDENGNISNVRILKDVGGGTGDAVKKVLENYNKKWKPAKNNGHPVKSYYTGTFNFSLQ